MNYLITGGYGLIGSQLANSLIGNIFIVSRSKDKAKRVTVRAVEILKDINDLTLQDLEYASPDVIYHCASTVDNYHIQTNPYIDMETNIKGTIHLLELVKQLQKKPKVIYLSTFFVYGNVFEEDKWPINEQSRTDPLALYPATKLCAESIVKCYAKLYGFDYLICRLSNVYGEKEDPTIKKAAFNLLLQKAKRKETISIYDNGAFYRDYIHVDDVVSALMFLDNRAKNDTFLIAYGKKVWFKDMIDFLVAKTGVQTTVVEPPPFHKVVGIRNFIADTSKLNALGWEPHIDYKEGIMRILKYA